MKPPLSLLSLLIMSAVSPAAAQDSRLVLVTRDSVPLRRLPASTAPIARYAHATLQLAVIGVSADSTWYRVGIGEDKGYQLRHGDHYWVTRTDVSEPRPFAGDVSVDLSLLEVPPGSFSRRATAQEYVARNGNLAGSYYVSPVYTARTTTPTCSSLFSICAETYRPGSYFIGPAGHPEAIAKQSSATDRALWIAGEHRHAQSFATQQLDELADQRALADSAASREGNDTTSRRGRSELSENLFDRFAASNLAKEPRQGPAAALAKFGD